MLLQLKKLIQVTFLCSRMTPSTISSRSRLSSSWTTTKLVSGSIALLFPDLIHNKYKLLHSSAIDLALVALSACQCPVFELIFLSHVKGYPFPICASQRNSKKVTHVQASDDGRREGQGEAQQPTHHWAPDRIGVATPIATVSSFRTSTLSSFGSRKTLIVHSDMTYFF